MDPRRRMWAMVEPVEPPEIDDDTIDETRHAARLLDVPEWVDPETGHLADDEQTRLEDH